jgi:hypothetical protein
VKLEDPRTIRLLWIVSLVVLALLVVADLLVEHHPHFGVDGGFAFHAWYGFAVCAGMVVISKFVVGLLLKRRDTYYDD